MTQLDGRQFSRLTRQTLALILAGGQGSRLHELTKWRAKPAVPFGGKFRIIDFPLSNCINSGIRRVGVATQYKSHSLVSHINRGWSGFKAEFGEFVEILPASMRVDEGWYKGTADAVFQNLDIIRTHKPEYVLILGGDHIYKMDYGPLVMRHVDTGADLTVCCVEVSAAEAAGAFGVIKVDNAGRVLEFQEKPANPAEIPGKPGRVLASMGNYVFNTDFLYQQLIRDADDESSSHDFGKDILPHIVDCCHVQAFRLGDEQADSSKQPYWRDVGTIDALWEANMELVDFEPELDLYDQDWPIYTYQMQLPSAKFVHDSEERRGMALNCIISGGCIVSGGIVSRSLLFSNVRVHSYSDVEDSVIMPDVVIGRSCKLRKTIVDRGTILPEGTEVGIDVEHDRARGFRVTDNGITLVTPEHFNKHLHRFR
ncbi:MAG: glucose-1-phosphate adenylyltransferase [Granulosicoccus sp.]